MENPWKFRKSSDIEMEVLFRRAENVWNEAIAANNAEWKQEYGKLVEQSRKELADKDAEWVEWVGENIIELVLNFQMTESNKQNLLHMWQERKKEIGHGNTDTRV